jgi:hypothetical protein
LARKRPGAGGEPAAVAIALEAPAALQIGEAKRPASEQGCRPEAAQHDPIANTKSWKHHGLTE